MSTADPHGVRRHSPTHALFCCRIAPHTRLLRLPVRCGTTKLRRLWNACFQLRT
ncbi:MAG: hypothetical protein H0X38_05225 [Planctomycetes bacterium]|nr:hypothetical protein [Planctomycetota bacterium]